MPQFPFDFEPFRRSLYTREELFGGFEAADPQSYAATLDFAIYRQYIASGKYTPADYFVAMMEALHDNSVTQALSAYLKASKARAVGVMGGHKLVRGSDAYVQVAALSRELTRRNFTMLSGGGPGAMEATHLGAFFSGADDADLDRAIALLAAQPNVPDLTNLVSDDGTPDRKLVAQAHDWFAPAYEISSRAYAASGDSIAIPTWLYGNEPSSPLASHIAKYFQNSIREDGLLALATNGVIYVRGKAGTLQEIFQDAAQNYYGTYGPFAPMVFLGTEYWTRDLPALPLVKALFAKDDYERFVLATDDVEEAVAFIESYHPKENSSERMEKYLHHEARRHD